jgi:hypothetical protein
LPTKGGLAYYREKRTNIKAVNINVWSANPGHHKFYLQKKVEKRKKKITFHFHHENTLFIIVLVSRRHSHDDSLAHHGRSRLEGQRFIGQVAAHVPIVSNEVGHFFCPPFFLGDWDFQVVRARQSGSIFEQQGLQSPK